jgi:hypothetical protein
MSVNVNGAGDGERREVWVTGEGLGHTSMWWRVGLSSDSAIVGLPSDAAMIG